MVKKTRGRYLYPNKNGVVKMQAKSTPSTTETQRRKNQSSLNFKIVFFTFKIRYFFIVRNGKTV